MSWVVPLALGGVAILVMAVFTMVGAHKHAKAATRPATLVGPRVLIHDINDDRCTGCDACVAVCPTNVLDLVSNKSRVLRFGDCIQCEACMWACPTEALVMFPEGAQPPPLRVPEIDEHFQTAVAGQYLIGEVAGKPLVKNAANLGRMVVEHMLTTGLKPGRRNGSADVDVVIVGSGPGGLSAALTCAQRGLTYVVLEKEQLIASTIARYPKGKLVMAEPYDSVNVSLLPVFDSSKEELIPIWRELIDRVGIQIKLGESVESVLRGNDGAFEVKTTVAQYRAQRVVLSIGGRGKPRTLGVQGENLPKVFNLLEDPDDWRGRAVLVVGGGDSAVEAALALSDAGAKVLISYRGKAFNRCQQKNKAAIESYAAQGRVKAKMMSQVMSIDEQSVILQMSDGGHKKYPNDAAFVLIGSDPPIAWLEKLSVRFVERPHQYQMGKTDDLVRRFLPQAVECAEDAARAAAAILGGTTDLDRAIGAVGLPAAGKVSGARKWLRAATNMLTGTSASKVARSRDKEARSRDKEAVRMARSGTNTGGLALPRERGKLDRPVPLSEFAKAQKTHTGHGRRDALTPGERTRVLRMLRDEGGRLADEDSQVFIGAPPPMPGGRAPSFDFDFDDSPPPQPVSPPQGTKRPTMQQQAPDAKQAVIVGLAQAMAKGPANKRSKRQSDAPPTPGVAPMGAPPPPTRSAAPPSASPQRSKRASAAPPPSNVHQGPPQAPRRPAMAQQEPPAASPPRRPVPPPFSEEPTRQVDNELLHALRHGGGNPFDEEDSTHNQTDADPTRMSGAAPPDLFGPDDDDLAPPPQSSRGSPHAVTGRIDLEPGNDESTAMANIEGLIALERANRGERPARGGGGERSERRPPAPSTTKPPPRDETTRAIDLRNDGSISDVDWDLD